MQCYVVEDDDAGISERGNQGNKAERDLEEMIGLGDEMGRHRRENECVWGCSFIMQMRPGCTCSWARRECGPSVQRKFPLPGPGWRSPRGRQKRRGAPPRNFPKRLLGFFLFRSHSRRRTPSPITWSRSEGKEPTKES